MTRTLGFGKLAWCPEMNNDPKRGTEAKKTSAEKLYSYLRLLREGVDAIELFEV